MGSYLFVEKVSDDAQSVEGDLGHGGSCAARCQRLSHKRREERGSLRLSKARNALDDGVGFGLWASVGGQHSAEVIGERTAHIAEVGDGCRV